MKIWAKFDQNFDVAKVVHANDPEKGHLQQTQAEDVDVPSLERFEFKIVEVIKNLDVEYRLKYFAMNSIDK